MTHTQLAPEVPATTTAPVDLGRLAHTPGVHVASLLFDHGLWFEAVVRGLRNDFGFTSEQALRAATVAAALRIK